MNLVAGFAGLPVVVQCTDGTGDFVLLQTSPTGDSSVIQMLRPDLNLVFRCQFGQFSVPIPPRVHEWYAKALINHQTKTGGDMSAVASVMSMVPKLQGAAGVAFAAAVAAGTVGGVAAGAPPAPLTPTDAKAGGAPSAAAAAAAATLWRCAVCTTDNLWNLVVCPMCNTPAGAVAVAGARPVKPTSPPPVVSLPAASGGTAVVSLAPLPTMSAARAAGGSGGSAAASKSDVKSAPAIKSATAAAAAHAAANKDKKPKKDPATLAQERLDREALIPDNLPRTAYLHVCKSEMSCTVAACPKIHGIFEPKQETRFQRELAAGKKDVSTGIAVCVFQLVGSCLRYHTGLCTYRHFTSIRELTSRQHEEFEAQLAVKSKFEIKKQCCPCPTVVYPDGEEDDDTGYTAPPPPPQPQSKYKAKGPVTAVALKVRAPANGVAAQTWTPLEAGSGAAAKTLADVQAEQESELPEVASNAGSGGSFTKKPFRKAQNQNPAAAVTTKPASPAQIQRRPPAPAPAARVNRYAATAAAAAASPDTAAGSGGSQQYENDMAAGASAANAVGESVVDDFDGGDGDADEPAQPPPNPLQAVVGALLHDAKRCLHVNALGANLKEHGISDWTRDYSRAYGSLADFIQSYPKVFAYDTATCMVSLSAAAASVASASLAQSASAAPPAAATAPAGGAQNSAEFDGAGGDPYYAQNGGY